MNLVVYPEKRQIGQAAAMMFAAQLLKNPRSVLGFATGSSPLPVYESLTALYDQGLLDFSKAVSFNLDEYVGLDRDHPASYHAFMQQNLFSKKNLPQENIHIPSGTESDVEQSAKAYDASIAACGGIDLQILGIGNNGHIAFNEPCDCFPDGTHKVQLSESTIAANARFFDSADQVPRFAVSMGIGSIMRARQIILIATGKAKAEAVLGMVKGDITPRCPASILQLHPCVTVFADPDAAALL